MQVIQVKCPKCGNPIYSKQKDTVFFCMNCNTMHIRNGGIQVLDVEIGDFNKSAPQDRVYVPFWRMYSTVVINNVRSEGGGFHKLASWFSGGGQFRQYLHLGPGIGDGHRPVQGHGDGFHAQPAAVQHQDGFRPGAQAAHGDEGRRRRRKWPISWW